MLNVLYQAFSELCMDFSAEFLLTTDLTNTTRLGKAEQTRSIVALPLIKFFQTMVWYQDMLWVDRIVCKSITYIIVDIHVIVCDHCSLPVTKAWSFSHTHTAIDTRFCTYAVLTKPYSAHIFLVLLNMRNMRNNISKYFPSSWHFQNASCFC